MASLSVLLHNLDGFPRELASAKEFFSVTVNEAHVSEELSLLCSSTLVSRLFPNVFAVQTELVEGSSALAEPKFCSSLSLSIGNQSSLASNI